jgi:hypothetical protein
VEQTVVQNGEEQRALEKKMDEIKRLILDSQSLEGTHRKSKVRNPLIPKRNRVLKIQLSFCSIFDRGPKSPGVRLGFQALSQ